MSKVGEARPQANEPKQIPLLVSLSYARFSLGVVARRLFARNVDKRPRASLGRHN